MTVDWIGLDSTLGENSGQVLCKMEDDRKSMKEDDFGLIQEDDLWGSIQEQEDWDNQTLQLVGLNDSSHPQGMTLPDTLVLDLDRSNGGNSGQVLDKDLYPPPSTPRGEMRLLDLDRPTTDEPEPLLEFSLGEDDILVDTITRLEITSSLVERRTGGPALDMPREDTCPRTEIHVSQEHTSVTSPEPSTCEQRQLDTGKLKSKPCIDISSLELDTLSLDSNDVAEEVRTPPPSLKLIWRLGMAWPDWTLGRKKTF